MAQKRKTSTSRRKSTTPAAKKQAGARSSGTPRTPDSSSPRTAGVQESSKQPRRREIAAAVCLLLGVFSFIGYFDSEPVFIAFFTGFVKRLIGYGFFVLPPALIMCAVILAFHKGYPVFLRALSTLSLSAVAGALVHVFSVPVNKFSLSFSMIPDLWKSGADMESGGIIAGSITEIFLTLFGNVGTVITLIIIATVLVLIAFNATVSGIIGAFSNREKRQYEREPYEPEPYSETRVHENLAAAGAHETDAEYQARREQRNRKYRYPLIPSWKRKKIDIPLDEKRSAKKDMIPDDPMSELYNKGGIDSPPWETPDGASAETASSRREIDDLPLDIPFMDGRIKKPPPVMPPIIEENFMTANAPVSEPDGPMQDFSHLVTKPKKQSPPADDAFDFPDFDTGKPEKSSTSSKAPIDIPIGYAFPSIDLLSSGTGSSKSKAGDNEVRDNSERLESAFRSFGINVTISNITRGPAVTQYEAELEAGIKLSRLTNLADDIALSLGTSGVRIAPMTNKIATVGIEVPNRHVSTVTLRDIIESQTFEKQSSKLTFAVGMNIPGEAIVGDISKLPHLLIAGTTGSGKSVCLNSIILSLLYKATPDEVKFIMIDPKMVEFKVYNGIPHLLVPVVTDVKKAAGALQWATFEMMKRYNLFAEAGARDIFGYNKSIKSNDEQSPMPQIVIVIDELADLMLTAAKEVEESVCRVAQMGRAAGMHLVIATQSPRADVITGLMKANIPSRISFRVASALESRIILDAGGNADKLVGNGDMLYAPIGAAKPTRVQGTWVSDAEREKVIDAIKKKAEAQYSEEVIHEIEKAAEAKESGGKASGERTDSSDYDELLPQAVEILFETGQGQASVSMLQRKLKLGYARAARIVDQMEEMGIVGQFEGSKPRTLLINRAQWREMQYGTGAAPADTVPVDEDESSFE